MGKDSLIKSTIPKNNKEKAAAKTAGRTSQKNNSAPRKKKQGDDLMNHPPQIEDLIFKQFDWSPAIKAPASPQTVPQMTAPLSESVPEAAVHPEQREVLMRHFSMTDIQAAAEKATESAMQPLPPIQANEPPAFSCDSDVRPDPVARALIFGAAGLIIILMVLIGASYLNSAKYYLVRSDDAVEIWRGRFSPTGKYFFNVLHDYRLNDSAKPYFAKKEIFPVIFDYYLEKADNLLESQSPPDFNSIAGYLYSARSYALSTTMKNAVTSRLNTIDRLTLLSRADLAITRGTRQYLESAIRYLEQAKLLTDDPVHLKFIEDQLAIVKERLFNLSTAADQADPKKKAPAPADTQSSSPLQ